MITPFYIKNMENKETYDWEIFLLLEEKGLKEDDAIDYLKYWDKQGSLDFYFDTNHTPLEHIKDMSANHKIYWES